MFIKFEACTPPKEPCTEVNVFDSIEYDEKLGSAVLYTERKSRKYIMPVNYHAPKGTWLATPL